MSTIAIQQYLADPEGTYERGYELYCIHGSSEYLKKLLANENVYTREKLRDELTNLARPEDSVSVVDPVEHKSLYVAEEVYEKFPEEVKQLHLSRKKVYAEMNRYRSQLEGCQSVDARKVLAFRILNLEQTFYKLCKDFNFYNNYKQLPAVMSEQPLKEKSEAELMRMKKSLTEKLSRYKDNDKKKANLIIWREELNNVNSVLSAFRS